MKATDGNLVGEAERGKGRRKMHGNSKGEEEKWRRNREKYDEEKKARERTQVKAMEGKYRE